MWAGGQAPRARIRRLNAVIGMRAEGKPESAMNVPASGMTNTARVRRVVRTPAPSPAQPTGAAGIQVSAAFARPVPEASSDR